MKIKTIEQYYGYLQRLLKNIRGRMSYEKTGGPAFPAKLWMEEGMTLRDYFAAEAMSGLMPSRPPYEVVADQVAEAAYAMADAMLKRRDVEDKGKK